MTRHIIDGFLCNLNHLNVHQSIGDDGSFIIG